mgnify:CR=1 FL=1
MGARIFKRGVPIALLLSLLILLLPLARAVTWGEKESTCPICGEKNIFQVPTSFGTYIYREASRFEYLFWPFTDENVLYTCKKCYLTTFMWDFEKIEKPKIPALKKILSKVKVSKAFDDYRELPIGERFSVAEKVYDVLGRDNEFWCTFYRAKGFHLEAHGDKVGAKKARKTALSYAKKMLKAKQAKGLAKETLLIIGAMEHLIGNDALALKHFKEAQKLKITDKSMTEEERKDFDSYLSSLLSEYIEKLEGKGK